jgi:integrase
MSARKIKTSWWADFRFNGERYRKRSPDNSKAGALAYEAMLRNEVAKHGSLDHLLKKPEKKLRFAAFANKWLELYVDVNNKPSEQYTKRRVLEADILPIFGKKSLEEIASIDIEDYKRQKLAKGLSPKTINNSLTILRKCLVTAIEWEELTNLPKIKLLKTATPKVTYLLPDEVQRLLNAPCPQPWKNMIHVAVRTGLRFSELIALGWEDVDLSKRMICVRRACVRGITGTPKNGRTRYVPLTQDAVEMLRQAQRNGKQVFAPVDDRKLNYSMGRWALRGACEAIGLRVVSWHALRHTFASHLVSKGASLKAVQELLGHSTIHMTLRYSHLNQENLRETIALLEPQKDNFWATGGQPEEIQGSKRFDLATLLQSDSRL